MIRAADPFVALAAAIAVFAGSEAQAQTEAANGASTRLNPTGKRIVLTVPLRDREVYLGDVTLELTPDDAALVPVKRLLDLLRPLVRESELTGLEKALNGRETVNIHQLGVAGPRLLYNPQAIALDLELPPSWRLARSISVARSGRDEVGDFERPANASAYMNLRGEVDYAERGVNQGRLAETLAIEAAGRLGPIAMETQAIYAADTGGLAPRVQRQSSRLVFDAPEQALRFTAGDLSVVGRGYQAPPMISGISVLKSYSVLQPQTSIRPTGNRSFRLERPSTVEVVVNGRLVRREALAPGNYDLRDFPFAQGSNDVVVNIIDDTGKSEQVRFNIFLEQSQLAPGISEYGLYAGLKYQLGLNGPEYSQDWAALGYYRRGLSEQITGGLNVQVDRSGGMAGAELVLASALGTFVASAAVSQIEGRGTGRAVQVGLQREVNGDQGRSNAFNFSIQARDKTFAPSAAASPSPHNLEVTANYSHGFSESLFGGAQIQYATNRDASVDRFSARTYLGWRPTPRTSLSLNFERDASRRGVQYLGLINFVIRMGPQSSLAGEYSYGRDYGRLTYSAGFGEGVGATRLMLGVDQAAGRTGLTGSLNTVFNRAELGLEQFASFDARGDVPSQQRTAVRAATAIAFADGAFAIGRPIQDSFAIVVAHRSLGNADVQINPGVRSYTARTGWLRSALQDSLASYTERTLTVNAQGAVEVDIGRGAFRMYPKYRAGYRLQVGSDYSVTAIGRLLDEGRQPLGLVSGEAIELAHPERPSVTIFTNRDGRFAASGLRAGRWRLRMLTEPETSYLIDVPPKATGMSRYGDMAPNTVARIEEDRIAKASTPAPKVPAKRSSGRAEIRRAGLRGLL